MTDFSIPILQWIQNLKHHLHFLLLSCSRNNAFIHSCKFAEMGNYLLSFMETVDNFASARDSTPNENVNFRDLLRAIENMTTFVKSYDQEHFLETVMSFKTNVVTNQLLSFQAKFNELCISLKLVNKSDLKPPYPDFHNSKQFILNDIQDCKTLLKELNNLLKSPTPVFSDPNKMGTINHRIIELHTIITEREKNINIPDQIVDKDEIAKQLDKYKEWEVLIPGDYFFDEKSIIGQGGYSKVFLGYQNKTNRIVAIKQLLSTDFTVKQLEMYKREIDTLISTQHPCLLPFVGTTLKPPYCILTEYMSGGSLYQRLHQKELKYELLKPTDKTIIAIGVAHGMEYLHSKKLIHRDLKSLNILLDSNGLPKICDFGLSRSQNSEKDVMTKEVGTSQWMAPEVFSSKHYNSKADVYSFGILMWEMLTEEIPYKDVWDIYFSMQIVQNGKRPPIPDDCPQNLSTFITECWDHDPEHRPDFKNIVHTLDGGEIEFAGTDRSVVLEFINTILTEDDKKKSPEDIFGQIDKASNEETCDAIKKFESEELMISLVHLMSDNNFDPKKVTKFLIKCFECRPNMIELFKSSFHVFFEFLIKYVDSDLIVLTEEIASKIGESPFFFGTEELQAIVQYMNDSNIDPIALKLLHIIVDTNLMRCQSEFITVIPKLIISIQIANDIDTLDLILSLFEKVKNCSEFISTMIECDGQLELSIALLRSPKIPLRLLKDILSSSAPSPKCAEIIIPKIKELISVDSKMTLYILKLLLQVKESFNLFGRLPLNPLASVLNSTSPSTSDQEKILALKISFLLFSSPSTFNLMLEIESLIEAHLLSENLNISKLSALCLTQLPRKCVNRLCNLTVSSFFKKTFSLQNDLTVVALRIAGILTDTKEGALFVENFLEHLYPLLLSKKEDVKKFTIIIFASLSSYDQTSECFDRCIEIMVENSEKYDSFPLYFLANITINPDSAVICSKFIGKLIELMANEVYDVFTVIWRIATTPESFEHWSDQMKNLVECLAPFVDGELHPLVMEIFQSISLTKEGKIALKNEKIDEYIKEKMCDAFNNDKMRTLYVRILSRIKNV